MLTHLSENNLGGTVREGDFVSGIMCLSFLKLKRSSTAIVLQGLPDSWTFRNRVSGVHLVSDNHRGRDHLPTKALPLEAPAKYPLLLSTFSSNGEACTLKISSLSGDAGHSRMSDGDGARFEQCDSRRFECIFDNMSIFSSFSSSRSFNSRISPSKVRTRSSSDSVYPRGNALRLNLSLVLHSKPTFEHCEQHGRIPSHLIFLLRHLSHACAIRAWLLLPTLITFMGSMPGILALTTLVCFKCPE